MPSSDCSATDNLLGVAAPEKEVRAPARQDDRQRAAASTHRYRPVAVCRTRLRGHLDRGDRAARQRVQTGRLRALRRQGRAVRGRRRPGDVGAAGRHHVVADQQPVPGARRTGGAGIADLRRGTHRRLSHHDPRLAGGHQFGHLLQPAQRRRQPGQPRSWPATSPVAAWIRVWRRCTPRRWSARCR